MHDPETRAFHLAAASADPDYPRRVEPMQVITISEVAEARFLWQSGEIVKATVTWPDGSRMDGKVSWVVAAHRRIGLKVAGLEFEIEVDAIPDR